MSYNMLKHRICYIRNMLHHTIGYDAICYVIMNYNTIGYDAIYCVGPPNYKSIQLCYIDHNPNPKSSKKSQIMIDNFIRDSHRHWISDQRLYAPPP